MIKILWLCLVGLFVSFSCIYAQSCGCDEVLRNFKSGFADEYQLKDAQNVISSYTSLFENTPIIYPNSLPCSRLIYAQMCRDEKRYIFYEPAFMTKVKAGKIDGSEEFLICHEIAHHAIGHTYEKYTLGNNAEINKALGESIKRYKIVLKFSNGKHETVQLNRFKIHEFEADALAVWMVYKRLNKKPNTDAIFNNIIKAIETQMKVSINQYSNESSDHPSFLLRKLVVKEVINNFYQFSDDKFKAVSVNKQVRQDLQKTVVDYYSFYITTASDSVKRHFTETELVLWKEFNRAIYIEPVVGWQVQVPQFRRNGVAIPASIAQGIMAGVRLGIGQWEKKGRIETDILWSTNHFKTLDKIDNTTRDIEEFRIQQIQIQPRYVFGNFKSKGEYRSSGMQLGIGPSLQIPFSFKYKTNVTSSPQQPTLKPSVGGAVGAGYWAGRYRVWGSYCYQPLRFKESKSQEIAAVQHGLRVDVSFRF